MLSNSLVSVEIFVSKSCLSRNENYLNFADGAGACVLHKNLDMVRQEGEDLSRRAFGQTVKQTIETKNHQPLCCVLHDGTLVIKLKLKFGSKANIWALSSGDDFIFLVKLRNILLSTDMYRNRSFLRTFRSSLIKQSKLNSMGTECALKHLLT